MNKDVSNIIYIDGNIEPGIKNSINIKNNRSQIINDKSKLKNEIENGINKSLYLDKNKNKLGKPMCSIKIPIKDNNQIKKTNYNTYIHNNLINKKIKDNNYNSEHNNNNNSNIQNIYKDIFTVNINNKKSRNQSNLNKQFNTNNNINNISFFKEKKINLLNNSTFSEKKHFSKQKLNLSYINKKNNNNLSHKKRIIKIKQNNDNNKLSLKQKIHLFHQRKEALINQYSNKNKETKEAEGNEHKKIIFINKK